MKWPSIIEASRELARLIEIAQTRERPSVAIRCDA